MARIEAGAVGVDVKPTGTGPDGGTVYRISQPVTVPGDGRTEVRFVVRGPDSSEEVVPVEVRWLGRPAETRGGQR